MQITFLTQYYPPEIGAPQARLSELAAHFVKRGHTMTVLTAMPNYPKGRIHDGYGGLYRRETLNGVEVIRTFIYPTQKADFAHRLANYFSFVGSSAFYGTFALRRPDYLLVESPPLFLGFASFWLSRLKRCRMIFNVSDLWPESAVRLGLLRSASLAYRLSARLERFCYQRAWLITGQSKSILADIQQRFPSRPTFHLSNGVDTTRFGPERASAEIRSRFLGDGEFVCLYAGLHGLAQGLEQVVRVAELLRDDRGLRFVLVGDGPEKKQLQEQAARAKLTNVSFWDSRPARDVPELLASADAILVPLKSYIPGAVPSKLYEAMATQRPVVLVASGEAAELVTRHRAGCVLEPGDVPGMAEAIRTLRQQASLRAEYGHNGRRAAVEHFDRSRIAQRFVEFLEHQLEARAAMPARAQSAA